MEIKAQFLTILFNIVVMWIAATVIMLTYSYRSNGAEFNFYCWFVTNTNRFYVGAAMTVGISVLIVIEPGFGGLLQHIGFNADKSPIALGSAIGTFLIAGMNGNKPATVTPQGT